MVELVISSNHILSNSIDEGWKLTNKLMEELRAVSSVVWAVVIDNMTLALEFGAEVKMPVLVSPSKTKSSAASAIPETSRLNNLCLHFYCTDSHSKIFFSSLTPCLQLIRVILKSTEDSSDKAWFIEVSNCHQFHQKDNNSPEVKIKNINNDKELGRLLFLQNQAVTEDTIWCEICGRGELPGSGT